MRFELRSTKRDFWRDKTCSSREKYYELLLLYSSRRHLHGIDKIYEERSRILERPLWIKEKSVFLNETRVFRPKNLLSLNVVSFKIPSEVWYIVVHFQRMGFPEFSQVCRCRKNMAEPQGFLFVWWKIYWCN